MELNNLGRMHILKTYFKNNHYIVAVLVFCVVLAYYLSLLHMNIAHAHDAPDYYRRIVSGNVQWHTHHLLYEPLNYYWLHYNNLLWPSLHPFKLLSAFNSVFGAASIAIIYLLTTVRFGFLSFKGLCCSFGLAGSFYYLNYATTVEVYHPALFFTLLTLYVALSSKPLNTKMVILIGVMHGLAMIFHQMHFLLGIVILPIMWRAGGLRFLLYVLSGSVIVIGTYAAACYFEGISNLTEFKQYFLGYMSNNTIVENSSSPLLAPFGLAMALLGGRILMAVEPFQTMITTHFADSMFDRFIILHHKTSFVSSVFQVSLYGVFVVLLGIILIHYGRHITKHMIIQQRECYLFIIVYSLFFVFWYPHNPEFWGAQMSFMMIALLAPIQSRTLMVCMTATIIAINLMGSGLPLLDEANNLYPDGVQSLFEIID